MSTAGRPDHGPWLGFDIGASKLLCCVQDGRGATVLTRQAETRRDEGPERVLARVVELGHSSIKAAGGREPRGVGAGFAGLVDPAAGVVLSSIMLPGWERFELARRLADGLGAFARVDNDATLAGLGELRALGSPPSLNMVLLTIGTGIGGAIVIGGRLYRGARGLAGEIGNTTVDRHGPRCWCGSTGCLNAVASGDAIARAAGQPDAEEAARAAAAGDQRARAAIEAGALALGAGVANLINIFDPDRVVLAGGVARLGEPWLRVVRDEARRRAFPESAAHVQVVGSVRGYDVGAYGAVCLAREHAGGAA